MHWLWQGLLPHSSATKCMDALHAMPCTLFSAFLEKALFRGWWSANSCIQLQYRAVPVTIHHFSTVSMMIVLCMLCLTTQVRSRHAPKNFQDYEIDVPSAKKINRLQPDSAAGMSYSYRPDNTMMPSEGNMQDATVMVHRLSQHTRTASDPARAFEAGSDKDRPSSSSGDDAPTSEAAQPLRYAPQQQQQCQHMSAMVQGFGGGVPQAYAGMHGATGPGAHLGFPGLQAAPVGPFGAAGIRQPTAAPGLAPLAAARAAPGGIAGRSAEDLQMLVIALQLMQQLDMAYCDAVKFLPMFLASALPFTDNPARLIHFMEEVRQARAVLEAQQQQQNQQPAEQHC